MSRKFRSSGFAGGQQGEFRGLVRDAWARMLVELPEATKCKKSKRCGECDYCGWYEAELFEATSCRSTTECNRGKDYDLAMAHFEALGGAGFKWQLKLAKGDAKRAIFVLRETAQKHGVPEHYLEGMARQMFTNCAHLPAIDDLVVADAIRLLAGLKRHLARRRAGGDSVPPTPDPF